MRDAILGGQVAGDQTITELEDSCFTGDYVTGDITPEYLDWVSRTVSS